MTFDATQIRHHFPTLNTPVHNNIIPIFFDNPAGTQVPRSVMDAVVEYYSSMNANAGGSFLTSQRSDAAVAGARERMADFINAPSSEEIVFGPNMTTLNFSLSRTLAKTLSPGDEIILTRMDHDANVSPWLRIAEDHTLVVKYIDIIDSDCTLDLHSYEEALTDRTKIVATVHASNAVGTVNPVKQIAAMAHAAGAYCVIDAVQSAPHVPIDVQDIDCDFLLCSAYKFYGPHIGILWGRYELLDTLPVYKVRPSKDVPPHRWETGTQSFETIHAVSAALDYLGGIGEKFGDNVPGYSNRRQTLKRAMHTVQQYERTLVNHLIEGLQSIPGVTIAGITDPEHYRDRVPTVTFVMDKHTPDEIAAYLAERHIHVWSGHYYAVEIMERLGYAPQGMVRVGLAHYNTRDEVDRLIEALKSL